MKKYFDKFKDLEPKENNLDDKINKGLESDETLRELVEVHNYEAAGDLCRKLGREEDAIAHYNKAIILSLVTEHGIDRYRKPVGIAEKAKGYEYGCKVREGVKKLRNAIRTRHKLIIKKAQEEFGELIFGETK